MVLIKQHYPNSLKISHVLLQQFGFFTSHTFYYKIYTSFKVVLKIFVLLLAITEK